MDKIFVKKNKTFLSEDKLTFLQNNKFEPTLKVSYERFTPLEHDWISFFLPLAQNMTLRKVFRKQ